MCGLYQLKHLHSLLFLQCHFSRREHQQQLPTQPGVNGMAHLGADLLVTLQRKTKPFFPSSLSLTATESIFKLVLHCTLSEFLILPLVGKSNIVYTAARFSASAVAGSW